MDDVTTALAPAAHPAHRAHRARRARRARADGGHHEHRLPAALPRIRRRAVRQRDDHLPRARRAQRHDDAPDHPPRVRDAAVDPAVRRRPRDRRGRGAGPRRGGPRRSHRPELRMPRPEGHPQGRRSRSAVEARAVPRHRHARGPRGGRHPADRSRCARASTPITSPTSTPDASPRMPASRPSRCTPAPPPSSTRARPTGRRSPRSSRPSRACPCSATATSGRPRTPCG